MHFRFALIAICLICHLSSFAQDSVTFRHNVKIFPIIEGGSIGYEHLLGLKQNRYHSVKGSFTLCKNDFFSMRNGAENYQEKSIQLEYRIYFKKNGKPMNGLYQGLILHGSHFEGEVDRFAIDPQSRFFGIVPIWSRAASVGYLFGFQKMTRSGFNFDVGYSMRVQKSAGFDYEAYWLDLIPYRPYINGLTSRIHAGIGLAF